MSGLSEGLCVQHFFWNDHLFIGVGIVLFACFIQNLVSKVPVGWMECEHHISRGIPAEMSSSLMNKLGGQIHFSFNKNPLSHDVWSVGTCSQPAGG